MRRRLVCANALSIFRANVPVREVSWWITASGSASATTCATASGSSPSATAGRAPNARIVALNLPNLGAAPYLSGNTVEERSIVQRIAVGLSDRVNALTSPNLLVADLMCAPRVYDSSSDSSDGFHPSDRGYATMAELAYPRLATGSGAAPSSSCAQRTLLPQY